MLRWPVEPMRPAGARSLSAVRHSVPVIYEPKFDGFRMICWSQNDGVRLQSRQATDLTDRFPDLAAALAAHLPAGVVVDGEAIIYDPGAGRTSFTLLQRRLTAGRRVPEEANRHPAHFVAFDLLRDADGQEIVNEPLSVRRTRLEQLLAGAGLQLPICPQTADRDLAQHWFTSLTNAGVEGLVIKKAASQYRPGRADGWTKVRARQTTEYVIGGVTGSLERPTSLLLGRYDRHGVLRHVGQSHPLRVDLRRTFAASLRGMLFQGERSGHPWPCPLPANWSAELSDRNPLPYVPVEPTLVAEVEQDTATDGPFGRLRHRAAVVRPRLDLRPADLDRI
jgi:ATP-dependent DNA ligase